MNKKYLTIGAIVIVVIAIVFFGFFNPWKNNQSQLPSYPQTVNLTDISLNFTYQGGEGGYSLIEPPVQDNLLKAFILMPAADYAAYQQVEETDVPASMSVFVFAEAEEEVTPEVERPGRITRLQNWAADNNNLTAYDRAYGTPEIVELDGVKALRYQTDGVYQQDIYLASYKSNIYMFVGQHKRPSDKIKKDFEALISTIIFE